MEIPSSNPHDQTCPDFASEAFAEARAAMRDANEDVDDATACVMMTQVWNITNRAECAIWDARVREHDQREAERARGEEQNREREAEVRAQEERAAAGEELKNRLKYLDIPMRPPPTLPVKIASRFATSKLQMGQHKL